MVLVALAVGSAGALSAQELRIGYMKHDIHEANVAIMDKWAKANGVKLHEKIRLSLKPDHLHFFDRNSEEAIV